MKKIFKFLLLPMYRRYILLEIYLFVKTKTGYSYEIFKKFFRVYFESKSNCIISITSKIPLNVKFPHFQNIVIGHGVEIGDDCTIYQDVTIGQNRGKFPKVGNNVIVYAGAKIFGNVKIGDNAIVGANAVVTKDVPNNAIVGGNPAKIIKYRSEDDEFY